MAYPWFEPEPDCVKERCIRSSGPGVCLRKTQVRLCCLIFQTNISDSLSTIFGSRLKGILKDKPNLQILLGSKEHKTSLLTQRLYLLHAKILFGPYKPTAYIRGYPPPPGFVKTTNRCTWVVKHAYPRRNQSRSSISPTWPISTKKRLSTVSLHTHVVILSTGPEK